MIETEGYKVHYLGFLICPVAIWSVSPYSFFTVVILVLFSFVLFLAQLVLQSVFLPKLILDNNQVFSKCSMIEPTPV